jgi:RNA polymerase sigma-70 factor (ECF subfamily)
VILSSLATEPRDAIDFDEFFHAHQPRLVACALALTSDRERARDAAQEALSRAYRDWSTVQRMDHPAAWVRRVLVNLLTDEGRRDRHRERTATPSATDRAWHEDTPPSDSPLLAAIRQLPIRQRTAVVLHYLDDLPVEQVAEAMGVAVGTVKATLHQARTTLARDLESNR